NLLAQANDLAGNVSSFSLTITRGQLLPPVITAQVVGGTVTASPSVTGTVVADHPLAAVTVALDTQAAGSLVSVLSNPAAGTCTPTPDRLQQINGAPLVAGAHTLYLVATDNAALSSPVIALPFTLDLSAQAAAAATVTSSGSPAQYTYSYTVFGPPA